MAPTVPPTLQALRLRAQSADTASARRDLLVRGTMFARFTIQEKTSRAEAIFAKWLDLGSPDSLVDMPKGFKPQYVKAAERCLADVRSLTDGDIENLWTMPIHVAERFMKDRVFGLGFAKSSFALACSGIGYRACIDSHIVRNRLADISDLLTPEARRTGQSKGFTESRYIAVCERLYGPEDSASGQWAEWLGAYVTDTAHTILLDG